LIFGSGKSNGGLMMPVQVKSVGGAVVLRKMGPDGRELELALDAEEAALLLGDQHQAVREARAFTKEARVRELARLEAEVARLRESLRPG
jgi:hypothetical protein